MPVWRISYRCRPAVVGTEEALRTAAAELALDGEMSRDEAEGLEIGCLDNGRRFAWLPRTLTFDVEASDRNTAIASFLFLTGLPDRLNRALIKVEEVSRIELPLMRRAEMVGREMKRAG